MKINKGMDEHGGNTPKNTPRPCRVEIRGDTMRKLLAIMVATAFVCAFAPMAVAAPDDTIVVTLTPGGEAAVIVYATAAPGDAAVWNGAGAKVGDGLKKTTNSTFTIENTGTVDCAVTVSATVSAGDWVIDEDGSPAIDSVSFVWQKPTIGIDETWDNFITETIPASFDSGLAVDGTSVFGLGVYMPPASSTNAEQTVTITFTATPITA